MNLIEIVNLSGKYLLRYKKRYMFLFFALSFGFCIITVITAVKEGISENLYLSGQNHYTGDIIFLGYDNNNGQYSRHLDVKSKEAVFETIRESKIQITRSAERTLINDDARLFFYGESLDLRYLNGVDWENERVYFNSLNYISGDNSILNDDSIIISEQIAKYLKVKQNDNIMLELEDTYKQPNTRTFVVAAVINDKSVFGSFKAYISKKTMNNIIGFAPDDCSTIGIFLKNRNKAEKEKVIIQKILSSKTLTAPVINTGDEFGMERRSEWNGIKIFVLTIPVYLNELYQIINAVSILNYFLYAMMLIIIFISSGVSYKLILHERIQEMGTMRTIGFRRREIMSILTTETLFLGTISVVTGLCLAFLTCVFIQHPSLDFLPGLEIMLAKNKLTVVFTPLVMTVNVVVIYLLLIIAAGIPAYQVSKLPLPEMIRGSMKG
jgi:putative ABC transport system permease protein